MLLIGCGQKERKRPERQRKPGFLGEKDKGWKSVCSCLWVNVQLFVYICSVRLSLRACVHMSLHACLSICMDMCVHTYVTVRCVHTCDHTGTGTSSVWTYRVWGTDSHKPAFQIELTGAAVTLHEEGAKGSAHEWDLSITAAVSPSCTHEYQCIEFAFLKRNRTLLDLSSGAFHLRMKRLDNW